MAEVAGGPAAEAAEAALGAWRRGLRADPPGVLDAGSGIVVVDVTGSRQPVSLWPPEGAPLVVVAVARAGAGPLPPVPRGADVLLSDADADAAPRPWVALGGRLDDGLVRLEEVVRTTPAAAATLVQVLRLGDRLDLPGAAVAESLAYGLLQAGPEHGRWLAGRLGATASAASASAAAAPAAPAPAGDEVLVERQGRTVTVTLHRPERRNAYSAAMRDRLVEALQLVAADPTIEAVHLRGAGPCFSSGGDLAEFGSRSDPATAHLVRTTRHAGLWLCAVADRCTAYVHGPCHGAGIELAAFCGQVVSSRDATFTLPEVGMGLIPGAGGTASIPARIGRERAAWMALSGLPVDADTALAWGLVDRLDGRLDRLAGRGRR